MNEQPEVVWHSPSLRHLYETSSDLRSVVEALRNAGALDFPSYASGLFPAGVLPDDVASASGYGYAWLRDSAHVAAALLDCGDAARGASACRALLSVMHTAVPAMESIIADPTSAEDVMARPPVRVDGQTLLTPGEWSNAQNDAVGATLWVLSSHAQQLDLGGDDFGVLDLIVKYLQAIRYWQDADSGYWEEARKVSASSIATVVAGLEAYGSLSRSLGRATIAQEVDGLVAEGRRTLAQILPNESIDPPELAREYDAALIVTVEPLGAIRGDDARTIIDRATAHLVRPNGVIRYPDDSYWTKDFRALFGIGPRTADYSNRMDERDRFAVPGAEAQWTIFDPLLSLYWLHRYQTTGDERELETSRWHLERSLGQFYDTPDGWRVPEAYFLDGETWEPNDHMPLLWSQANVLRALTAHVAE